MMRVGDLDLEFIRNKVVALDKDGPPRVFAVGEAGGNGVRLIRTHLTVLKPLFNCAVLIPSIVAGEGLLRRRVHVLEDLILALKDGDGLNSQLVGVLSANFLADLLLVLDVLMCLVDINMSSRKSLFKKRATINLIWDAKGTL